jgi:hypothetical protein
MGARQNRVGDFGVPSDANAMTPTPPPPFDVSELITTLALNSLNPLSALASPRTNARRESAGSNVPLPESDFMLGQSRFH